MKRFGSACTCTGILGTDLGNSLRKVWMVNNIIVRKQQNPRTVQMDCHSSGSDKTVRMYDNM